MLDSVVQRNNLLAQIERARNSTVIAYVLHDNAVIADDALPQLYDKLQALGKRERVDLLLYARGGVPEVCWRLLSLLREFCDHLGVIVAPRVQGAGALLALGADEIVMGPLSELGGVEGVRNHPLLPHTEAGMPIPVSLDEIKSLLRFLGEQTSASTRSEQEGEARPDADLAPQLLAQLFSYIHPLALANLQQADALSRDLTRKALLTHMRAEEPSKLEHLVELFNGGFHSPIYTANRVELREAGLPVTYAPEQLWSRVWDLLQVYQAVLYSDRPDQMAPGAHFRYVCLIESQGRTTGLRQVFSRAEGQERILQLRWETAVKGPEMGPGFGPSED